MINFFEQYQINVNAGPHFEPAERLPITPPDEYPVKFLAFYLPQFHSIAENDEWWGKGFTEWTNVTKALPRYEGHLQPRLPSDLGFYDLSNADTIHAQAQLAKRAGISGFCFHDYWFSGRKVLDKPLALLLANKDIDLPFCLNWANENWSRRWDGSETDLLLEQRYDPNDMEGYVRSIIPALADHRYIHVDGRPLIMIYRPEIVPNAAKMFERWREFCVREGHGNPYIVMVQSFGESNPNLYGLDAAAGFPPHGPDWWSHNDRDFINLFDVKHMGHVTSYSELADELLKRFTADFVTFPGVCPGWDNEARKPRRGVSFYGATPKQYRAWLGKAAEQVLVSNKPDERIVFINAWNEWAEGAVLEPDRHFGSAFLVETRALLDELAAHGVCKLGSIEQVLKKSLLSRMANGVRRKAAKLATKNYPI